MTKSFLVPLGANDDTRKAKLLFDEYIDGVKKGANRSKNQPNKLDCLIIKYVAELGFDQNINGGEEGGNRLTKSF